MKCADLLLFTFTDAQVRLKRGSEPKEGGGGDRFRKSRGKSEVNEGCSSSSFPSWGEKREERRRQKRIASINTSPSMKEEAHGKKKKKASIERKEGRSGGSGQLEQQQQPQKLRETAASRPAHPRRGGKKKDGAYRQRSRWEGGKEGRENQLLFFSSLTYVSRRIFLRATNWSVVLSLALYTTP